MRWRNRLYSGMEGINHTCRGRGRVGVNEWCSDSPFMYCLRHALKQYTLSVKSWIDPLSFSTFFSWTTDVEVDSNRFIQLCLFSYMLTSGPNYICKQKKWQGLAPKLDWSVGFLLFKYVNVNMQFLTGFNFEDIIHRSISIQMPVYMPSLN